MIIKIQYTDQTDRQNKIDANKDKILIEEQNIIDGNFLIFSDVKPLETQVSELQQDNLILMDALATSFEKILQLEAKIDTMNGGTV